MWGGSLGHRRELEREAWRQMSQLEKEATAERKRRRAGC